MTVRENDLWTPSRLVVIRFPDAATANRCLDSAEYQEIFKISKRSARRYRRCRRRPLKTACYTRAPIADHGTAMSTTRPARNAPSKNTYHDGTLYVCADCGFEWSPAELLPG